MKVSIVTTAYNSEKTIKRTIESVLNQTYPDIEYWIIDGSSSDGTLDIIRSFEPRFNGRLHWISEKDEGIYDAIEESWIYGVELLPDFSGVVGEPQLLLRPPTGLADPTTQWENRSVLAHEAGRRWNEGSYTFRHDSTWYIMYSANFFGSSNYAVGYATGPSPLGPFVKAAENPILQADTAQGGQTTGTGHNMAFRSHQGQWLTVYHGRTLRQPDQRVVFIGALALDSEGRLQIHPADTLTLNTDSRP